MNIKQIFVAMALVCASVPAFAAEDDRRIEGASGRSERTYYNDAERRQAHAREVGVISAEPYQTEIERERVRRFYIVPQLGVEVATIGAQIFAASNNNGGTTISAARERNPVGVAPAMGINAGWRLGHFNLGARYQGSVFVDSSGQVPSLALHKVYAELGFNLRRSFMIFNGYVAGGWAFATTQDTFTNGIGGKVGIGFDFLLNRYFSIGPGVSFDVHGYRVGQQNAVVAYGGSGLVRFGFHI